MSDQHASQYYFGPGTESARQTTPIESYIDNFEDAGFGSNLRCGMESHNDGDNDTDDLGSYAQIVRS